MATVKDTRRAWAGREAMKCQCPHHEHVKVEVYLTFSVWPHVVDDQKIQHQGDRSLVYSKKRCFLTEM